MEQENQELETQNEELETLIEENNDELETSELTEEDYFKEKARREKAEKALIEFKKQLKAQKPLEKKQETSNVDIKTLVKEQLEEERFFSKNEDANLYKDKILEYKNKWLSYDDAYVLATRKDKEIEKNKVYSDGNITWKTNPWENVTLLSIKDYDKLPTKLQDEYLKNTKAKLGKVKFK